MLALGLTLAASLAASPAEAWADQACPPPSPAPQTNLELKAAAAARAECLQQRMNAELDRTLLPLKKKRAPEFHTWMDLEAGFNRWTKDVCAQEEELPWVDVSTRQWSRGSAAGLAQSTCLQTLYAERGWLARRLAEGDLAGLRREVAARKEQGKLRRDGFFSVQQALAQAAQGAPEVAPAPSGASRAMTKAELLELADRMERVRTEPGLLAPAQCALLKGYPGECAAELGDFLLSWVAVPRLGG